MNDDIQTSIGNAAVPRLEFNVVDRLAMIDQRALRRYRLERVRAELQRRDFMGAVLSDPMNIHYATGTRNMPIWTMHAPGRYAFVTAEGPIVMFEFGTCQHLSRGIETVDETRIGVSAFYFFGGPRLDEKSARWVSQIVDLVDQYGHKNRRLAVDRCDPWLAQRLVKSGIELFDAQEPLEQARRIKSAEEIASLQLAMDVCDVGIKRMRETLRPGLTENQILSVLHATNIAHGGEFMECSLLASGPRSLPWFQQSSNRTVEAGDIVAFDTDMIGPTGYLADISRSYVCPGRKPTPQQLDLYALAQEQVTHNIELLQPGVSFREFTENGWKVPQRFFANRYMVLVHGVGLTDEYPAVLYDGDQQQSGYDGYFEENMVVSVESYLGLDDGDCGVKLEEQVLITRAGAIPLSKTPLDNAIEIK
jgi:Xaa-Pro aminopeptidase